MTSRSRHVNEGLVQSGNAYILQQTKRHGVSPYEAKQIRMDWVPPLQANLDLVYFRIA
ncbi:MAG: hypothetical protein K8S16_00135 [Bacteroidales bacterium]|nr:hypothetical protein [Bacteroidales bacterium]